MGLFKAEHGSICRLSGPGPTGQRGLSGSYLDPERSNLALDPDLDDLDLVPKDQPVGGRTKCFTGSVLQKKPLVFCT